MNIQVCTDDHIRSDQRFEQVVRDTVTAKLNKFREKVTNIQLHFADENASKGGPLDKRCTIEARVAGLKPLAASHSEDTVHGALVGAVAKIERVVRERIEKRAAP